MFVLPCERTQESRRTTGTGRQINHDSMMHPRSLRIHGFDLDQTISESGYESALRLLRLWFPL